MSNFIKSLLTNNEEMSFKVILNNEGELSYFQNTKMYGTEKPTNVNFYEVEELVKKLIRLEMIQIPKDRNFFTYFIEIWCIDDTDDLHIETYYDYDNFDHNMNGTMLLSNFVNQQP